jgi:hypothetical protein
VLLVGRDIHEIPGPYIQDPVLELKPGSPLKDHQPLVLGLVVPEGFGRTVPRANDPFDSDSIALLENGPRSA